MFSGQPSVCFGAIRPFRNRCPNRKVWDPRSRGASQRFHGRFLPVEPKQPATVGNQMVQTRPLRIRIILGSFRTLQASQRFYCPRTLLGAKGIATRSKDATIGAPGLTTSNKNATKSKKLPTISLFRPPPHTMVWLRGPVPPRCSWC